MKRHVQAPEGLRQQNGMHMLEFIGSLKKMINFKKMVFVTFQLTIYPDEVALGFAQTLQRFSAVQTLFAFLTQLFASMASCCLLPICFFNRTTYLYTVHNYFNVDAKPVFLQTFLWHASASKGPTLFQFRCIALAKRTYQESP